MAKSRNVQNQPRLTRRLGGWVAILFTFVVFGRVMKESTDPLNLFSILFSVTSSNAKTVVCPRSSPLGSFRRRGEAAVFGGWFLSCRRQTVDARNWLSWGLQLSFWWSESSDCFLLSSARFYNHSSARNTHVACSRRSNSRAREKNSRRIKKEGRLEGERGREGRKGKGGRGKGEGGRGKGLSLLSPPPPLPSPFSRCTI